MYYHVIENVKRDGKPVYRLVKTYKTWNPMMKFLLDNPGPFWVLDSKLDHLVVPGGVWGGFMCQYFNTGGWGEGVAPVLPIVNK